MNPTQQTEATQAAKSSMPSDCCAQELEHCHGTLVRHRDGTWECLEDDAACSHGKAVHGAIQDCRALEPPCGCVGG